MKYLIILFAFLSTINAFAAVNVVDGNDSGHGGDVFQIGGATRLFDKLEYEEAFNPSRDIPEFRTYLRPRLAILGNKLPSTGRFLLRMLSDAIAPRWYFVKYQLRNAGDSGPSSLILAYEKAQVALNTGTVVQIDKEIFAKLKADEKAWLLVHEALWTAIGANNVPDGATIRRLTSLLFHPDLVNFSAESIGAEFHKAISNATSPLLQHIDEDLHNHGHTVLRWVDVSTDHQGHPTICLDETDQCVMRGPDNVYWTALSPGAGDDKEVSAEEAADACRNLKHWGGFSDWRLPSSLQSREAFLNGVGQLGEKVPAFAGLGSYAWTTKPVVGADRQFAYDLSSGVETHYETSAALPFRCVRGDYRYNWRDVSTSAGGAQPAACTPGNECVLKEAASGMQWAQREAGAPTIVTADFSHANDDCKALNWGGKTGWRIPKRSEVVRAQSVGISQISMELEAFGDLVGPEQKELRPFTFYIGHDDNPLVQDGYTYRLATTTTAFGNVLYPWICVHD